MRAPSSDRRLATLRRPRLAVVRPTPSRSLGDKLQEIAGRSPIDLDAFDKLADLVLSRLNAHANAKVRPPPAATR